MFILYGGSLPGDWELNMEKKQNKTNQQFQKLDGRRTITPLTYFIVRLMSWQSNMLEASGNNSGKKQYNPGSDLRCSFHTLVLNPLTR